MYIYNYIYIIYIYIYIYVIINTINTIVIHAIYQLCTNIIL